MTKMRFTMLPVGQGTGTLVQVLDGATPVENYLIDLGSLWWHYKILGWDSAAFVTEELEKSNTPTLDGVFLSHGDLDHYNLIQRVLSKFNKPGVGDRDEQLVVNHVLFSGKQTTYKTNPPLDRLNEYRPLGVATNLDGFGVDECSEFQLVDNGVKFIVLVANTVKENPDVAGNFMGLRRGTRSYLKNLESLVLAVGFPEEETEWFVATGDATGLTMARCNDHVETVPYNIAPVRCLTLPHHGSTATTYDILGPKGDAGHLHLAETVVRQFVESFEPEALAVSSGEVRSYKLPWLRPIGDFGKDLPQSPFTDPLAGPAGTGVHFYTAHMESNQLTLNPAVFGQPAKWPPSEGWYTVRTEKAVFTTDYYKQWTAEGTPIAFPPSVNLASRGVNWVPPPPRVTGWAWEVDDGGNFLGVTQILQIPSLPTAHRQLLRDLYGLSLEGQFAFVPTAPPGFQGPEESDPVRVGESGSRGRRRAAGLTGRRDPLVIP